MEERKRFHFLYRTTNKVNGKYYIGVHTTWNLDDGYLGSGDRLKRSVRKYGRENFVCEVIRFFDSRVEAFQAEVVAVDECLGDSSCMNIVRGGFGNWPSWAASAGGKAFAHRRQTDPELRNRHAEWSSASMKSLHSKGIIKPVDWTGRTHSEATKTKISTVKSGSGVGSSNSQYGRMWMFSDVERRTIKVSSSEVSEMLTKGWTKGRKKFA